MEHYNEANTSQHLETNGENPGEQEKLSRIAARFEHDKKTLARKQQPSFTGDSREERRLSIRDERELITRYQDTIWEEIRIRE